MIRFLSLLLLLGLIPIQSYSKQDISEKLVGDFDEELIIGIAKKNISLRETPKRLSKKLNVVIPVDDTVLIKENHLFDDKRYIKVYTFDGMNGWASRKHINILEEKIKAIKAKEKPEKLDDKIRFEDLAKKIENKSR